MTDRCLLPGTTAPSWRRPCDLQASAGAGEGISGALCSPLCSQLPGGCVFPTPCQCHGAELPSWGCHQFFREGRESWGGGVVWGLGSPCFSSERGAFPWGPSAMPPYSAWGAHGDETLSQCGSAQASSPASKASVPLGLAPSPPTAPHTPPRVAFSPHRGSAPQLPCSYLGLPRWERAVSHPAAPAGREVAGVWEGHPGWWWGLSWGGYF